MSVGEAKSTLDRRSALHLFRLGEAMLRIVRNKNRPLLHMMRAWSVVAPHLVEVVNVRLLTSFKGLNYVQMIQKLYSKYSYVNVLLFMFSSQLLLSLKRTEEWQQKV